MWSFLSLFSALGEALYFEEEKMKDRVGGAFSVMVLSALPSCRHCELQVLYNGRGCVGMGR